MENAIEVEVKIEDLLLLEKVSSNLGKSIEELLEATATVVIEEVQNKLNSDIHGN